MTDLDTYDSGSERWFQLAMVQLGPVYFLKERMSQDGMLATLSQAAQAHSGVLGHELRERGRKSRSFSHLPQVHYRWWAPALAGKPCEAFGLILLNSMNFPSRAAQPW